MKTEEWRDRLTLLLTMLALMWLVEAADRMLGSWFEPDQWGIVPRQWRGLWGLLISPFLHADWGHLAANTVPFLVLGGLLLTRGMAQFLQVTVLVAGLGGLCVWLLGPGGTVHIGASGLIFGYFGFLLVAGLVEGSWTSLFIALGVGFLYGSLIWGVLPGEPGISWQGHLFSLLAGGFAGWGKRSREPAIRLE